MKFSIFCGLVFAAVAVILRMPDNTVLVSVLSLPAYWFVYSAVFLIYFEPSFFKKDNLAGLLKGSAAGTAVSAVTIAVWSILSSQNIFWALGPGAMIFIWLLFCGSLTNIILQK